MDPSKIWFFFARIIVGVLALLLLFLGYHMSRASISGEIAWGKLAFGVFVFGVGLWFAWSAVRPHRGNVDAILSEIVVSIFTRFF